MAKVTMLKSAQGSADHIKVATYKEGETYDLPDFLAKAFVDDMKVAEYPGRRAAAEAKMDVAAPENKMATADVETKAEAEEQPIAAAAKKVSARRQ